ncbi:MAG: discoidin domain-containing protein [Ignavibacteriales bacterium]|nr:discoidin domain-containing protein [Ignavibacteriales bacterium]
MRLKYSYILILFVLAQSVVNAQSKSLDDFESLSGWKNIASDQVNILTSLVAGRTGKCIKIDFNFVAGSGYCGIQKEMPIDLPDNFQFSFFIKGNAPSNNLEFKLVDKSGLNVWWLIQRNYEFPNNWKKIIIKKRHIQFAWGPIIDKNLHSMDKIEFFISSSNGGKGSVYLDDFRFDELEKPSENNPVPGITASSASNLQKDIKLVLDNNPDTEWRSTGKKMQNIMIDLKKYREFGGLIIDWDLNDFASEYSIQISNDNLSWDTVYNVKKGKGGRAYINLRDCEARFIKLDFVKSNRESYCIKDIFIKDFEFSDTPEKFFAEIAKDKQRGYFPKYCYNEQSYWTVVGVNSDQKEALINEEGMVEIDKENFSIEPFISINKKLITWNDVTTEQQLEEDYLPIPSVKWKKENFELQTKVFASGQAGKSFLYLCYKLKNKSTDKLVGNLYLALRPFQVNPPWQFLNNPGGTAKITSIKFDQKKIVVNNEKEIYPLIKPDGFGAAQFDEGDITEFIVQDNLPKNTVTEDEFGFASAAVKYNFSLLKGEEKEFYLVVPFYNNMLTKKFNTDKSASVFVKDNLDETIKSWKEKLNNIEFNLPASAQKFVNTIKTNLAYILINRDGPGIQPGSRSYERSWIRDGSLTSSALLKMGIKNEVKEFINWYSSYQLPNGKVPCVVDKRGPDPVPENDSQGELIFAILQYFNFTKDTSFLKNRFENVLKAVDYIDTLITSQSTSHFKDGNDSVKTLYGLLPESISHEGYSDRPMHSYWDDFFAMKGLKDAVRIAEILGYKNYKEKFMKLSDNFKTNLYNSINLAVKNKNINYIPGCAELGDFDATSTAIAIYPCNEMKNLPQPYLKNTFDKYYQNFETRLKPDFTWLNYTPYEVRVIGTFIYLDQVEKAHELLKFFFKDQRPQGWNHWAEVVWKDSKTPRFIGDMPHTWVGSDFISAARSFFVYEDEQNNSLVIGAGLYREWFDSPDGISIKNLPTYFGNLNYSIKKEINKYRVELNGNIKLPEGGIKFINPVFSNTVKLKINEKEVNGKKSKEILVNEFPAVVEIYFNATNN